MLETSFKTYGEHGARKFWPAGLTLAPYQGRPSAKEVEVEIGEVEIKADSIIFNMDTKLLFAP